MSRTVQSTMISALITILFAFIGTVTGVCTHLENRDLLEYSCTGGTPADLQSIPATTEKIRISRMPIPRVTADTFGRFGNNLWVLSCSNCGITEIEPDAFRSLSNLQQLSLDSNRLTEVKGVWFHGLDSLTYLDLNYNYIRNIEPEVFQNLPSLVDLRISGNKLECIDLQALAELKELKRMFLSENPDFKCPNAVSKFLEDRGVTFERDPEWLRIPNDITVVEVPPKEPTDEWRPQQPPYHPPTPTSYYETSTRNRDEVTPGREHNNNQPDHPQRGPTQYPAEITTPRNLPPSNYPRPSPTYPYPPSRYPDYLTTPRSYPPATPPLPSPHPTYPYPPTHYPGEAPTTGHFPSTIPSPDPTNVYPSYPPQRSPIEIPVYPKLEEPNSRPPEYPTRYPTAHPEDRRRPYPSPVPELEVTIPNPMPPATPERPTDPRANGNGYYESTRYPSETSRPSSQTTTNTPRIQWSSGPEEEFVETGNSINNGPKYPNADISISPDVNRGVPPPPETVPYEIQSINKTQTAQNFQQGAFPLNNTYILKPPVTTDLPLPTCKNASSSQRPTELLVFYVLALIVRTVFTETF